MATDFKANAPVNVKYSLLCCKKKENLLHRTSFYVLKCITHFWRVYRAYDRRENNYDWDMSVTEIKQVLQGEGR